MAHLDARGTRTVLIETFLQQIQGVDPDELDSTWLGLKLTPEPKSEFQERLYRLVNEFRSAAHPDGDTYSFFSTLHPDHNRRRPAETCPPQKFARTSASPGPAPVAPRRSLGA
ncbi:hypothetical protein [Microbacterium kyungheense]|uniref:hypothetical protein n=1 Tax=Microbacterium kyungheense TaxID=1263636 RepID=UPI00163CE996|nr:hypothetical protein [Microbacterium kyungheense]